MLTITNTFFYTGKIKETGSGAKYMHLCNIDKNKDGEPNKSYFTLWLNDRTSKLVSEDLKAKMKNDSVLIIIDGWVKVEKSDKYTNLTVIPKEIKEFKKKESESKVTDASDDDSLPF